MPLDSSTAQRCNKLGWDCTGIIHRAPNVQHFVGWIAACGFLCSGNPSDGSTGIDTGWGWVHELGHNTVQDVLTMVFPSTETRKPIGCGVECNNNILAGLSMMSKYHLYAQDSNGSNFRHPTLYANIKRIHEVLVYQVKHNVPQWKNAYGKMAIMYRCRPSISRWP